MPRRPPKSCTYSSGRWSDNFVVTRRAWLQLMPRQRAPRLYQRGCKPRAPRFSCATLQVHSNQNVESATKAAGNAANGTATAFRNGRAASVTAGHGRTIDQTGMGSGYDTGEGLDCLDVFVVPWVSNARRKLLQARGVISRLPVVTQRLYSTSPAICVHISIRDVPATLHKCFISSGGSTGRYFEA